MFRNEVDHLCPSSPTRVIRPRHEGRPSNSLCALDYCEDLFQSGNIAGGMSELTDFLFHARCALQTAGWKELVQMTRQHPVTKLIHRCPILHRAFHKPRGYPGDAELIDHVYGCGEAKMVEHPGTLSGQIYSYLAHAPVSRAVRYRRERLAQLIDEVRNPLAEKSAETAVVSIAAGHLREIELTSSYQNGCKAGPILALDQDPKSLAVIAREYAELGVTSIKASVKDIIARRVALAKNDLIYAAGLFDYVSTPVAQVLAKRMFDSLNPGGCLLLTNFLPNIRDCGFMEAVLDWWLIYRTEGDVQDLLVQIPAAQLNAARLYRDPDEQIVFLEVTRA